MRAATAMKLIGAMLLIFRFLEIGQYFLKRPALITQLCPVVVVLQLASYMQQAVHGTGTAQNLAAWPLQTASGDACIRFRLVAPVSCGIMHDLEIDDCGICTQGLISDPPASSYSKRLKELFDSLFARTSRQNRLRQ